MSLHLLNLVFRFCLEMTSLIAIGMWGWHQSDGWLRYVFAIGLPLIFSAIWGVFNVPNDTSRGGSAPIVVPGIVRLIIEFIFFGCGAYALLSLGHNATGGTFIVLVILHYLLSFNRIGWLLNNGKVE
jgi:hypothetical protein